MEGRGGEKVGGYKFFWMGREEGYHGVGVLVVEEWIEVLDVKRWSERIMVLTAESGCGKIRGEFGIHICTAIREKPRLARRLLIFS